MSVLTSQGFQLFTHSASLLHWLHNDLITTTTLNLTFLNWKQATFLAPTYHSELMLGAKCKQKRVMMPLTFRKCSYKSFFTLILTQAITLAGEKPF